MPPLMKLPDYDYPRNALINFAPINDAIDGNRQNALMNEKLGMDKQRLGMEQERLGMAKAQSDEQRQAREVARIGKESEAIHAMEGPQRQAIWQQWTTRNPSVAAHMGKFGIDPNDHINGPKFLAMQAGSFNQLDQDKARAQIEASQASAAAARANAGDAYAVSGGVVYNKRTGAVTPLPENASKPDAPSSVREWQAFNMLSPADQERYLNMKRSDKFLDTGTGFVRPSQSNPTAPPIPVIDKNNAEEARQKKVGTETGELQMGAPKAAAALESADAKSDLVVRTIGEAKAMIGATTAGMGGAVLSRIPGTAARDLAAKIDTLKANAGFGELQTMRDNSPTGGALGAVAIQELAMLQATITSLEQAQTPDQLSKALDAYETFIRESKVRRRRAYEATYGANRQQPPPMGGGITAPSGNVRPPGVYNWTPQGLTPAGR